MTPTASEWEIEPPLPESEDFCPVCDNLNCTCPPDAEAETSLALWYDSLTFDECWKLSWQGDDKATEEILARQWSYNRDQEAVEQGRAA